MSAFAVRKTDSEPISSEKRRTWLSSTPDVVEAVPDRVGRRGREAVEIGVDAVQEVEVVVHRLGGLVAGHAVDERQRTEPGLELVRCSERLPELAASCDIVVLLSSWVPLSEAQPWRSPPADRGAAQGAGHHANCMRTACPAAERRFSTAAVGFTAMEGGEGAPTAPAAEVGRSLLEAKLSVPRLRPGTVSRDALIRSARRSDRRVVAATAPAGYGKTTLLAEWAAAEERPVAWVSLDGFDDDPAALLFMLASAYDRVSPNDSALIADMGGLGVSTLGRAAPRLAAAFGASPQPFVLMLDDLHEIRSPACHDALGVVVAGIPQGSQMVAASRSEQPHVPRLRVSGDVLELGPDALALDAAGARQIFSEASVPLTAEMGSLGPRAHGGLAGGSVPRRADRARGSGHVDHDHRG